MLSVTHQWFFRETAELQNSNFSGHVFVGKNLRAKGSIVFYTMLLVARIQ